MTYGFETLAIHAGQDPEARTGSVVPPIFQTSTYAQDAVGVPRLGYEYSRSSNPTRDALQECLAAIEGGRRGLAFASGLAAEDTLLRTVCKPGDHVIAGPAHRTQEGVLGRETARERQPAPAALDRGEALLQRVPGRVAGPAVLISQAGRTHRLLRVGAGLIDRRHDGAGARIRVLARVDGKGVEAVVVSGHAAQG